jgi:Protein of unknown function (DUF3224)
MTCNCTFKMNGWDEKTLHEFDDGSKMTQVSSTKTYTGDLEAEAVLVYVMFYVNENTVKYTGYERFTGLLHGKQGSFTLDDVGEFVNGVASSTLTIISESGRGDLKGITGSGKYSFSHAEEYKLTLMYDL